MLEEHPEICVDDDPTSFFDVKYHQGLNWYRSHFEHYDGEAAVGDESPGYFVDPANDELTSLLERVRSYRHQRNEAMLDDLIAAGLDAVEAWYPNGDVRSGVYADVGVEEVAAFAAEYDLLSTGGSGSHGSGSGKYRIGTVGVDEAAFRALQQRAAVRRPLASSTDSTSGQSDP